jgi:hypothetical protein
MPRTFNFPVWLKSTDEEQAAEEQRQALLRASFTRAKLTDAERLIGRGALLEKTAQANLEQSKGTEEESLHQSQLADALAMQGRYADAASIHPDPVRKEFFEQIGAAIEMDNSEKCSCPDSTIKVGDVDLAITPRFERTRIFSLVHKGVVSLVECSKCGHRNARPLRSRLLKHNDALNKSEGAKRPVLNDAQILKA